MGVAAQTMAWQQRARNRPGPFAAAASPSGASDEQPSGLPQVEVYLGGWVDLTAAGRIRYQQGIRISRGQPDENGRTNPSTATFRLANQDGAFSPRNPLSPYYGIIDRNTPCRISVQSGNGKSYRFWGEVSSWPQDWDPTGNDAWVDITASGILRRLGQGSVTRPSAMTGSIGRTGLPGLQAYWPCEDAAGSTQIASGISGAPPMTITGAPTLATNTDFVGTAPLPVMNTGTFVAQVPRYQSSNTIVVRFLLEIPSGGIPDQTVLARVSCSGTIAAVTLTYTTAANGTFVLKALSGTGSVLFSTPSVLMDLNQTGGNGQLMRFSLEMRASGANINAAMTTVGANWPNGITYTQTWTSNSVGAATGITMALGGAAASTVMGQITVQSIWDTLFDLQPQMSGYAGEQAGQRISRLCAEAGIAFQAVGSNSVVMGVQPIDTLLNQIQQCVDADGGILSELTTQLGLGYRTRNQLLNQTPQVTLDYAQAQLSDVPKPVDDDTYTRNDIAVTRTNGSFTRATQSSGPLNIQAPPAGVGQYDVQVTLNCQTDAQTADLAGWLLHLGTVPEPRYPGIGVQLARQEITSSSVLRPQILSVQPGDRVLVVNPPSWLPPDPISALVIGYQETFDQFLHQIVWNTRPESPFRVAICDDPVFGVADTDGSTLAAPAGPTDSTILVATTNPSSPLWTTNAGDFPFDIAVGGERMTVTGVTGGTSPQTFTVTRSVNGVVKPQTINTNVQLFQPAILSM